LCTRSISAASFDFRSLGAAEGAELGEAFASGLGEPAALAGVAEAFDAIVPDPSVRACGLAMNPASATLAASAATIANGASVKNLSRPMTRIFIELD
jgi:hypothetical protein